MTDQVSKTVVWKVRDSVDGQWMTQAGKWSDAPHLVGEWSEPEHAAKVLLGIDADRFGRAVFIEETRTAVQAMAAADVLPPPLKVGAIPSSWLGATGSWNARDMLNTKRIVEARSIDPADIPAVVDVFNQVSGRSPFRR